MLEFCPFTDKPERSSNRAAYSAVRTALHTAPLFVCRGAPLPLAPALPAFGIKSALACGRPWTCRAPRCRTLERRAQSLGKPRSGDLAVAELAALVLGARGHA